jgi:hypothetical protein
MTPRFPAPDPFESPVGEPALAIPAPTAVFLSGPPTPELDRMSDAILAVRPGVVFICSNR